MAPEMRKRQLVRTLGLAQILMLGIGGTMIMLSEKGELIWGKLTEEAFKETHRQKILDGLCWSKPVMLGNRLYARDAQGTVICLKLE